VWFDACQLTQGVWGSLTGHAFSQKAPPAMKLGPLSGYDAPVASLLFDDVIAGVSNPTYVEFHGNLSLPWTLHRKVASVC
jgi:hypothetical protein